MTRYKVDVRRNTYRIPTRRCIKLEHCASRTGFVWQFYWSVSEYHACNGGIVTAREGIMPLKVYVTQRLLSGFFSFRLVSFRFVILGFRFYSVRSSRWSATSTCERPQRTMRVSVPSDNSISLMSLTLVEQIDSISGRYLLEPKEKSHALALGRSAIKKYVSTLWHGNPKR